MDDLTIAAPLRSNLPEYTVSELARALKRSIEENFACVRVRGEISGFKRHASGHCYLSLKDADAVIDAVCWRMTALRLGLKPEDGMEVVCTGRLTTFPGRSKYQLVIDTIELAGVGALLKVLEDRRKRLAAEGLFAAERKKKLPFLPEVIGIVTSPTGAVIRDILHRLADRFPRHVLLWPVAVQGEGAAAQVAAAINGFNRLPPNGAEGGGPVPRPQLIIVARGGGSLEDLMAFNEEIVVRAAADSAIPLISAVGHETDTTLIDHASDRRAPTPTAAAEMAVPVRLDLVAELEASPGCLTSAGCISPGWHAGCPIRRICSAPRRNASTTAPSGCGWPPRATCEPPVTASISPRRGCGPRCCRPTSIVPALGSPRPSRGCALRWRAPSPENTRPSTILPGALPPIRNVMRACWRAAMSWCAMRSHASSPHPRRSAPARRSISNFTTAGLA
jgi:exodeoxyribonuclease VII large subunit